MTPRIVSKDKLVKTLSSTIFREIGTKMDDSSNLAHKSGQNLKKLVKSVFDCVVELLEG